MRRPYRSFSEGFPSKQIENGELSLGPKKPVALLCDDLVIPRFLIF